MNATALVVYLYLCGNRDGYEMALSPKAIRQETGMADSTCRDQINVLISKGYLVPRKEGSNLYDFYEDPSEVRAKAEQPKSNTLWNYWKAEKPTGKWKP